MNFLKQFALLIIVLAISLAANAAEVYEKVNKQGTVEFSDQPSTGSKEINVTPNVVHTTPASAEAPAAQSVTIRSSDTRVSEKDEVSDDGSRYREDVRVNPLRREVKAKERHEVKHALPEHKVKLR